MASRRKRIIFFESQQKKAKDARLSKLSDQERLRLKKLQSKRLTRFDIIRRRQQEEQRQRAIAESRRQEELKTRADSFIKKINQGKIRNISSIPKELRPLVNVKQSTLDNIRQSKKKQLFSRFVQRKLQGKGASSLIREIKATFGKQALNELNAFSRKERKKLRGRTTAEFKAQRDSQKVPEIKPEVKTKTKITGTVEAVEKAKGDFGLKRLSQKIKTAQFKERQKKFRPGAKKGPNPTIAALAVAGLATNTALGLIALGKLPFTLIKASSTKEGRRLLREGIRNLPADIKRDASNAGKIARENPEEFLVGLAGFAAGTAVETKVIGATGKLVSKAATRASPKFRKVATTELGEATIKNVDRVGDVDIIPGGQIVFKTDPKKFIKKVDIEKRLKPKPSLAKTSDVEKRILKVVRKRGDTITGSFATETLLKKQFSRRHKDLDILAKSRKGLMKDLKKEFGSSIRFRKKLKSIVLLHRGKEVADLIKFRKGEAGFVKRLGTTKVSGINLATPKAVLGGKVTKLGQTAFQKRKTLADIKRISGEKIDVKDAKIRGAFGWSKKELKEIEGRVGPITTSQIDLLGKGIFKKSTLKLDRWFFGTPPTKAGKAQIRVSRLGLGTSKDANLIDVLLGDFTLKKNKPQMFIFPEEKISKATTKLTKGKIVKQPGFVVPKFSSELEVVLGLPNIIKRGKRLAIISVKGKSVPIYELKKFKLSNAIIKDINRVKELSKKLGKETNKAKRSKIRNQRTAIENKVYTKLKKDTGLDYKSSLTKSKKVLRVERVIGSQIPRGRSRLRPRKSLKRPTSRPPKRPPKRPPSRPPKRPPKRPPSRPSKSLPSKSKPSVSKPARGISPLRRISKRAIPKPPIIRPRKKSQIKIKKRKRSKIGFNVKARPLKKTKKGKIPKLIKINRVPLTKSRAKDLRNYIADTSLARTATIKRTKGKPKKPVLKVPLGYSKRTSKKFRTHRIIKGKRKALPKGKVIEKRTRLLDTKQERQRITLRRRIKEITPKKKVVKKAIRRTSVRKPIRRTSVRKPIRRSPVKRKVQTRTKAPKRRTPTRISKPETRRSQVKRNTKRKSIKRKTTPKSRTKKRKR